MTQKFSKIKGKDQNNLERNWKRRLTGYYIKELWLGLLVFTNLLFTCLSTKWQMNHYWFRSLGKQNFNSFWSIYTGMACHKYILRAPHVIKESFSCLYFEIFNMAEALGLCHEFCTLSLDWNGQNKPLKWLFKMFSVFIFGLAHSLCGNIMMTIMITYIKNFLSNNYFKLYYLLKMNKQI